MSVEAVSPFGAPAPEPEPGGPLTISIQDFLTRLLELEGSDLHLTAGAPPTVRVHGDLLRLDEYPLLDPETLRQLIYAILPQRHRERFEQELELDTSYSLPGKARFRVNVYMQRDAIGAALRLIPYEIRSLEQLGMPANMADLARLPRGLVLVTGPTGSGKSTTLAAMIDIVNREKPVHIMTVEDPIEYLHQHKTAIVNQREIGADTNSFPTALKYVLRQDPDIILIGEMRDLETIEAALTIAETGHLVFATLHTNSTYEAVNRIVDVFPSDQQKQILTQLAFTLEGVVTQQLIPKSRGGGRVMCAEVLVCTPAIKAVIREAKTHQIYSLMQAGQKFGMQTMNQALLQAVLDKALTPEDALDRASDRVELEGMLGKVLRNAA
jgi:twitching motility protein PilT